MLSLSGKCPARASRKNQTNMQTIFGETRNYSVLFYEIVVYDNLNFRFGTGLNAQFCIVCLEDGLIVKPYSPIRGYGSRARRFLYLAGFSIKVILNGVPGSPVGLTVILLSVSS